MKDAWTTLLAIPCLFYCLPMLRLSTPPPGLSTPPFLSMSSVRVPGLSTPSMSNAPMLGSSAPPSTSGHLPISGLFTLLFAFDMHMPGLSAPSLSSTPIPRSSAPLFPSSCLLISRFFIPPSVSNVHVLGSFALSAYGVLVPAFFALLSLFGHLPVPGSSALFLSDCLPVPELLSSFPYLLSP